VTSGIRIVVLSLLLVCAGGARAETPEEWVKLLSRVHGGFSSFLPVGIRIGSDAMERLKAQPRELAVVYYRGDGVPCPCPADGLMLAIGASPDQGTAPSRCGKIAAGHLRRGGDPAATA
jgi:formylmethanofuran dehydrogenase subunit E